jgi:2'-5' RNA ligase
MLRSPTARLFVAVDPPEEVCDQLCAWARAAVRAGGRKPAGATLRVLEPELLHVTLCFLGNRPVGEMDALAEQLAACEGKASALSLGAPLWLPERNPRALAVELYDERGRLAKLQGEVVAAMQEASGWQANGNGAHTVASAQKTKRRFHPHITVARLGQGAAPRQRKLPPTPSASFTPRELVLYRSWLSLRGASYEAVASQALG